MNSKVFARGKAGDTVWRKMLSVLSIILLSGLISLAGGPHAGSGNLSRAGTAFGPEEAWAAARPVPVMDAGDGWYEGTTAKSSFTTINIVDDYWPDGTELEYWDASEDDNFTVAAYVSADGKTLTITGNGSGYIKAAGNCKKAFAGFTAVTAINGIEMLDMSDAQMLDDMFYNCQSLVSLNLDDWDVSNVASFRFTFDNCYALTSLGPNNLKDWDTSSVSLFYGVFADCKSLKAIDVSNWDLSSCWNIDDMFAYCSSLTSIDVSNWDVSYVQHMIGTFGNCTSLKSIDVSNWDTSRVTSMNGLFSGCKNLTSIDVSGFDTSSCVSLGLMFYNCEKLTSIDVSAWDTRNVENFQGVFDGCESLTSIDVSTWDTSAGTDMSYLFDGCIGLTKLDLGNFNTSSCVDMTSMFSGCTALAEINGLSRWNTSSVEDMTWMFRNCTSIETLDLSTFDTSACTDFTGTFSKCSGLKVLDISSWNTTAAKYMSNLFSECTQLQQVSLGKDFSFTGDGTTSCVLPTPDPAYIPEATGKWQAVAGGTVSAPAGKAYAPADVPSKVAETYVPEKAKTPVLAASNTWYKGTTSKSAIVTINIVDSYTPTGSEKESWDASEAQDGSVMAYVSADGVTLTIAGNGTGCVYANPDSTRAFGDANWNFTDKNEFSSLITFNGGDVLDMSKVTNATWMFYNAQLLESIDVSTWDVSNVTVMDSMFGNCYAVEELSVGSWNVSNVTDFTDAFLGCHAVTSLAVENWDIGSAITLEGIFCGCKALTSLDLSSWDTTGVQDMNNLLSGCQALVTAGDLSGWDTSSCTDMHQMFQNCDALESVDVSNFDTTNVTDMSSMFYSCLELTTIDVSSWDTSKVSDMSSMFSMCWNLTSLDVSGFDTAACTDMSSMFANCSELAVIDVSGFETSKVENMGSMFSQCRSVEELDVTGFDTRACNDMGYMFYACHALTSLDLSSFDTAACTDMAKMLSYMNRLRVIKLGEEFSFAGSGTTRLTSLPTPDPTYIPGATGKWQAVAAGTIDMPKGAVYSPDAVPNNVAETYVAELQKTPVLAASNSWYKGSTSKSSIVTINIVDSYTPTGSEKESWDASEAQDGSVMAYVSADGKTLTVAGNGSGYIKANADSMFAFDEFSSVTAINGLAMLDTSGALKMTAFFADNASLTSLEGIEDWDVSNCTTFAVMFNDCTSLTSLDLSKWDMSSAGTIDGLAQDCVNLIDLKTPTILAKNLTIAINAFESCEKLESVDVSFMCSGKLEYISCLFQGCESLKTITGYETLVTAATEDMRAVFNLCGDLEYLDLSQWVTDNSNSLGLLFGHTYSLSTIDGLENWNTGNVESMDSTFVSCWVTDLSGISGWDVSNVKTFDDMFASASKLTSLDLSSWSTDAAEDMGGMFNFCANLTTLKLGSGFSTEDVTDFNTFLYDCWSMKTVDLSVLDTCAASDMTDFFTGMDRLQQVTLGENFSFTGNGTTSCVLPTPDPYYIPNATGNWQAVAGGTVSAPAGTVYAPADVPSNVAETYVMEVPKDPVLAAGSTWYKGTAYRSTYTAIDIVDSYTPTGLEKESWDASAEQDGSVMAYVSADGKTLTIAGNGSGYIMANQSSSNAFQGFTNTTDITGLGLLDVSNTTSMTRMFYQCNLVSALDVSNWDVSNVNYFDGMFGFCKALTSFGDNQLADWDVSRAWDMSEMFYSCDALESIAVDDWDVSSVWDMGETFAGCDSLTTLNVGDWNTSSLSYALGTFADCSKLPVLDVSDWKTSKVTNFTRMFSGCESLTVLDVSGFETGSCTRFGSMFMSCRSVKILDVSDFDTSKATTLYAMFMECDSLSSLDVSSFNTAKVVDFSYFVRGCDKLSTLVMEDLNTSSATDMSYMFEHCPMLTQLDLPFETSKVTMFQGMFNGCTSLMTVNVSSFDTSAGKLLSKMFSGCSAMEELNIGSFDTRAAASMSEMFNGMVRLQQVTLGENFSFTGNGSTSCVLPTPDPVYIDGAIGKWQAVASGTVSAPAGTIYLPADVPSNVAETYVMPNTTLSVDVPVKVTLAASADGTWCTPTAEANRIINHSLLPVRVTSAEANAANGFTMLANAELTASDASNVFAGTITAGAGAAQDLTSISTSDDAWTMAAETDADDSDLISLQLAGSVANVEGKYFTDALKLLDVAYTFELVL